MKNDTRVYTNAYDNSATAYFRNRKFWSKKNIAIIATTLSLIMGAFFAIQAIFKKDTEPHFISKHERAVAYNQLKTDMIEQLEEQRQKTEYATLRTISDYVELESIANNYFDGLFELMDSNVETNTLIQYATNYFTESKIEQLRVLQDTVSAKALPLIQQSNESATTRGSKHIGDYAYNNKTGIEYLHMEALAWGLASFAFAAVAVIYTVVAILATIATFGGLAAVLGAVVTFSGVIIGLSWGNCKDASEAASYAQQLCGQGKGYSVYRLTGIFGITSGYSTYEW